MTDTLTLSMTDEQLERARENAALCMSLAKTMEARAAWLERIDELTDEQNRRRQACRATG